MEVCLFWRVCECGNEARVRSSTCTRMRATGHFTTRQNQRKNTTRPRPHKNRVEERKGLWVVCRKPQRDSRRAAGRTAHTREEDRKFRGQQSCQAGSRKCGWRGREYKPMP